MKITGKITGSILLLGLLCGLCAIPILLLGFPEWIDSRHSMEESHVTEWLLLCGLGGLVLGFLLTVLVLLRIIRRVVLPLRDAIDFADRLAAGEFPSRLAEYGNSNDEVRLLYTALNLLRDRQMNLNSKLKLRLSREAETRRDAESHSMLQLRIIARMLPEMRIPLGSIKGFCRILLLELESEKPDRREMVRLLDETGHRVGMISRQIDRLLDISRLDRDRWDRPGSHAGESLFCERAGADCPGSRTAASASDHHDSLGGAGGRRRRNAGALVLPRGSPGDV